MTDEGDAEVIAREFHSAYEELAPTLGYRTKKSSAVPWEKVPQKNRTLMVATVDRLLSRRLIDPGPALEVVCERCGLAYHGDLRCEANA